MFASVDIAEQDGYAAALSAVTHDTRERVAASPDHQHMHAYTCIHTHTHAREPWLELKRAPCMQLPSDWKARLYRAAWREDQVAAMPPFVAFHTARITCEWQAAAPTLPQSPDPSAPATRACVSASARTLESW